MDLFSVLTLIAVAIANIGTTITLFLWATNNSAKELALQRESTEKQLSQHRQSTEAFLKAIQDEMKDFHGRLCAIEERNKSKS